MEASARVKRRHTRGQTDGKDNQKDNMSSSGSSEEESGEGEMHLAQPPTQVTPPRATRKRVQRKRDASVLAAEVVRSRQETTEAEQTQTLRKETGKSALLAWIFVIIAIAGLATFFSMMDGWHMGFKKSEPFVPLNITPYMPSEECYRVSDGEIALKLRGEYPLWDKMRQSMLFYMKEWNLTGIAAFHLGHSACFIMIKQQDGSILEMYNAELVGYSAKQAVVIQERSFECPDVTRMMTRAHVVTTYYNDGHTGVFMHARFNGTDATAFQSTFLYSRGKTICHLHQANTDRGFDTLKALTVA